MYGCLSKESKFYDTLNTECDVATELNLTHFDGVLSHRNTNMAC